MQKEVLGDRYQLQDRIGHGGMATVYRGQDIRMERTVAVKVLRDAYSTDAKFVTRFQREAKAASALHHPNIVQVYDYGQSDGVYYIVMELIDGTDLRRYLRSRGILAVDRAVIIAHDIAMGLGAAHRRNIVNRDVKPQNVLVGRDGSIKLTDFGIAMIYKDINTERLTTTGMTLGTVQYYAPEQAQGEIVTPAADVYALGIVIYEMLTGRTPFDGDTPVAVAMQHIQEAPVPPSQYNPRIPLALEEIILRCLEKTPEMRYRDGSVLAQALETFMEETFGDNLIDRIGPGVPRTTGPSFNTIPQRPGNSRQNGQSGINGQYEQQANQFGTVPSSRNGQNELSGPQEPLSPLPQPPVSSPNNMMPPLSTPEPPRPLVTPGASSQQGMPGQAISDANTIAASSLFSDQTIRVSDNSGARFPGFADVAGSGNGFNGANGFYNGNGSNGANGFSGFGGAPQNAVGYDQYQPNYAESGATRPFQPGPASRTGATSGQRDSRFMGVVTALILVATLIFLGFSVLLAAQLGLIPLFSKGKPSTNSSPSAIVPRLIGETYTKAQQDAQKVGFKLRIGNSITDGTVESQDPAAGNQFAVGSTISVSLIPLTPTPAVPQGLAGKPVGQVTTLLQKDNISYKLVNAGPNDNYGADIVKGTNPNAGSPLASNQTVQVYVWNCSACTLGTPVATSTPNPTPQPATTPTPGTTPNPTPTTGTTPNPTPTTGTTPTPTPTTGTTPTPTPTPGTTPTPAITPTPGKLPLP